MKKKMNKKGILTTAMILTASAFATLGACGAEETVTGYNVPAGETIEVGVKYTPDFEVSGSITAQIVDLAKAPKNSYARVKDGSFTPDVTGEYTYVVRYIDTANENLKEAREMVTVKAVDTTAPVLDGVIENKTADVGLYTALKDDLAGIQVRDNCAKVVEVYAETIVYNGQTTVLGKGVESVRLSDIGEYTVNVVAEDFSGNKTKTSYKITTSDISAPIIDSKAVAVAWAKDGKVAIPQVTVVDNTNCTLSVKLNGTPVTGDTITAGVGVYTLTYTAKDIAGNETSKDIKLIVNEDGVINDFAQANEETLWGTDGVRLADGKLKAYYMNGSEFELTYTQGFAVGDWTDYVSFEAQMKNNQGAKLTVTPYFLVDGVWKETAVQQVEPKGSATVKVYLSDYNLTKVDGVKLALRCDGGVVVDLDDVKVSKTSDTRTVPAGYTDCKVSAQGSKELAVNQTTKGVVKYTIYSNVACDVMTVLNYENGSVSAIKSLKAGLNEIVRYPDAEAGESLTSSKLVSMVVSNFENYDVKLAVSSYSYEDISTIDMSAYAITSGSYSVGYNETFAIPSPFTSSLRWYNDLTVSVKQGSTVVKDNLAIGSIIETVGDNALSAGDYSIVYSFKDLVGVSKTITYSLTVEQNVLTATLVMPALFYNAEGFDLPDPEITSAVYDEATVQSGATVKKFYRLAGRKTWMEAEGGRFSPVVNKTYEIKYVIEYDGIYREINAKKFIHVNKYTLDFEPEDAVGENDSLYIRYLKGDTLPDGTEATDQSYVWGKSRFLFDGGYYDYRQNTPTNRWETTTDWAKSGSTSLTLYNPATRGWGGFLIRPVIANDKGVNAVQFWMKAEKDVPELDLEVGAGGQEGKPYLSNGWRKTEACSAKAGEHFYTVFLQEPIQPFESIGGLGMTLALGNRLYIDDVEFVYIDRLSANDSNTYEDQIDHTDGYELIKPTISSDLLSAEELAKVSFVLTYSLNGKDEIEIKPNAEGKYILKLAEGEYGEVVFKWTITTPNKWSPDDGDLVRTFVSDEVLINAAVLDFEHPEIVLQDSTTTLALPTSQVGTVSNAKVEYKPKGTDQWIALADGNMNIPTDTAGWFDLRYTADVKLANGNTTIGFALSEIYVRDKYVLVDFEGSDPYNGGYAYDTSYGGSTIETCSIEVDPENPNNHVQKTNNKMQGWEGVWFGKKDNPKQANPIILDEPCNIVYVRIYSPVNFSNYAVETFAGMNSHQWNVFKVDLKQGWNEFYLLHSDFNYFSSFNGKIGTDAKTPEGLMFDDISLLRVELSSELPTTGYYGEELTLPAGSLKGINGEVSYRVKGTEDWTTVEDNKFIPMAVGIYEVRYAFAGITEIVREITVELKTEGIDGLPNSVKAGETVTVPTVTAGTITAVASYRLQGATEWTPVTDGSFATTTDGTYEVRFYFEAIDVEIIETLTATPANEFLLANFETPFDEDDANYTNYNHVNTGLNAIRPTTDSARVDYYRWEEAGLGGKSLFIASAGGWEGPVWRNGIELGFTTNTFKIKMRGQAVRDKQVVAYLWVWDETATKKCIEVALTIDFDNAVDLGNGWFDYTLTTKDGSSYSHINGFEFNTRAYYIDDIRAIDTSK